MRISVNFTFAFQSTCIRSKQMQTNIDDIFTGIHTHLQVLNYYRVLRRVSEGGVFAFLVMQFRVVHAMKSVHYWLIIYV